MDFRVTFFIAVCLGIFLAKAVVIDPVSANIGNNKTLQKDHGFGTIHEMRLKYK